MKTTIDRAGRLVLPKSIRQAARIAAGMAVEVRVVAGKVEIEPLPVEVTLERRGRLVVAVPKESRRKLTSSEVDATLDEIREGRGEGS